MLPERGLMSIMAKRIFSLVLCICVLLSAGALYAGATTDVCFISVNDTLLELNSMPYFKNGVTYIPYWVFSNFGIGYTYFNEGSTAMVYQGKKVMFFNLVSGETYDINDTEYSAQAVFRGGIVYLPVQFMQDYFQSFSYTYIQGTKYGNIARLKDSSVVLSDSDFLKAASSLMRSRYNAYISSITPSPSPTPVVTPSPEISHEGVPVYLNFIGLPSDVIISTLRTYNADACFYLTAEDIRSAPDTVRRLNCEGYNIGILCSENIASEYTEASQLLFEAARTTTVMVTAIGENAAELAVAAEESDLSFWYYNLDALYEEDEIAYYSSLTSIMDDRRIETSVFFTCGKTTESLLRSFLHYLFNEKYSITCPGNTDVWSFE